MKIVFLGTPRLAQIVLSKLANSKYKPSLVITGKQTKAGRGQSLMPTAVESEAKKHDIEVSYNLADIDKSFDLAILVAFGKIIPKSVLGNPKYGFLNIHPSLLPEYRGPSPIQSAILKGETKSGVTIMKLDEEVDHGPTLAQKEIGITEDDTHESLIEKLGSIGADLLLEIIPSYISGDVVLKDQDHTKATFTERIEKNDGLIDLGNPPSKQKLNQMIKAFYPWPGVYFEKDNKRFKLLPDNKIQPEGKKPITIEEFKNGYKETFSLVEKLIT